MNAEVFPTTEKSAKNRNLRDSEDGQLLWRRSVGCGHVHLRERRHFADHGLAVRVPRAHHEAVKRLVEPESGCEYE